MTLVTTFLGPASTVSPGTAGGSNTELQYNNGGTLAGISSLTYDGTNITSTRGVTVDGSADEIQLKVQGHSTQTSNIFEIENSAGSDLFTVDNVGAGVFADEITVDTIPIGLGGGNISTNIRIGSGALANTASNGNSIAIGSGALATSTDSNSNIAIGVNALNAADGTNSRRNVAVGHDALKNSTSANSHAIGFESQLNATSGSENMSYGFQTMSSVTTGSFNQAYGGTSLFPLTTGSNNIALGRQTGRAQIAGAADLTTGNNNVLLGVNASVNASDASDCIAIGREALAEKATGATSGDDGATFALGSANHPVGARGDKSLYPSTHGEDGYLRVKVNGTFQKIPLRPDSDTEEAYRLRSVEAGITASATQTQGQQPLTKEVNEVDTVSTTNDVVTLDSALAGKSQLVINNGANTLQIFPASGDDLGAGVDTSTTLAAGSNQKFVAYNATNWVQL